eukprot:TCALIF_05953-PA protein Name:"Protein of unknown function" AED:0.98 eAED:1.00 QI:0/0/0/0.33/0/0/3/0/217
MLETETEIQLMKAKRVFRCTWTQFTQEFVLANVARPILCTDFFIANDLTIDLRHKKLVQRKTLYAVDCDMGGKEVVLDPFISTLRTPYEDDPCWMTISDEFPGISTPKFDVPTAAHGVAQGVAPTDVQAPKKRGDRPSGAPQWHMIMKTSKTDAISPQDLKILETRRLSLPTGGLCLTRLIIQGVCCGGPFAMPTSSPLVSFLHVTSFIFWSLGGLL